jgi:hypothetical protein
MRGDRPADEDRLPWLEPYRETNKPGRPLPRRGYGKPFVYGLAAALLLAAGAGGYWLGQRSDEPARPQPSATIALPKPRPAPVEVAEAAPPATPQIVEPAPTKKPEAEKPEAEKPKPAKPAAKRRSPPRRKIRSAGVETPRLDAVRAQQERLAKSRPWPKMPSPGPAGQVIQLGAFSSAARANNAYGERIARYPALAGMPKVVVPVITKPDGRILYVLRLGTTSRQQSKTVCRNLRASGDHCLVIG